MRKKTLTLSVLAAAVTMATGQAQAAAFQLAEQSTTGLGRAYAGEGAAAENASVLGRNPAAMTLFDRSSLSAGAVYVNPEVDVEGKGPTAALGQSQGLPTRSDDIADDAVVPFFYYVQPINEQWAAGLGIFTNYGLSTTYQDNHYAGPVAGKTALTTININPNIAFKANEHISLGAGFNAVYADAELIRHAGVLYNGLVDQALQNPAFGGNVTAAQNYVAQQTGLTGPTSEAARLTGDDWGYGWNIGLMLEADEHNRWALTYRSEVDLTLEGKYAGTSSAGQTVPGKLDLTLPAIAELSGFHQVDPAWAVHYGIMWTQWSSFEELKALGSDGGTLFEKPEKFNNSWRVSAGLTHQLNDQWTLRGGLAYDQSPVPEATRSISIPDVDRTWYTLGATYAVSQNLSVDAAFAFLDGGKVDVVEDGFAFTSGGDAYLMGLQMNYQF
ncbi:MULTISPECIES: outer membrane protein transport protein [Oceanimonas]|uniref:Outer membrane protein transport protein n=1 Tax=Oceanimonas smirnovii TaxID=264574 RepID=A0ABW7NXD6_9GAMM|nr:outer membrane protein transport protein [Oceanimonas sp. CAM02]MDV2857846.1 outer membrane protein transport protein [Oceanimonas sp. CAM02]